MTGAICRVCGTDISFKKRGTQYCDACRGPARVANQREKRRRAAAQRPARPDPRVERISAALARGEVGWDRIVAVQSPASRCRLLRDAAAFVDESLGDQFTPLPKD